MALPLHAACECGNAAEVESIIKSGAFDLRATNEWDQTALELCRNHSFKYGADHEQFQKCISLLEGAAKKQQSDSLVECPLAAWEQETLQPKAHQRTKSCVPALASTTAVARRATAAESTPTRTTTTQSPHGVPHPGGYSLHDNPGRPTGQPDPDPSNNKPESPRLALGTARSRRGSVSVREGAPLTGLELGRPLSALRHRGRGASLASLDALSLQGVGGGSEESSERDIMSPELSEQGSARTPLQDEAGGFSLLSPAFYSKARGGFSVNCHRPGPLGSHTTTYQLREQASPRLDTVSHHTHHGLLSLHRRWASDAPSGRDGEIGQGTGPPPGHEQRHRPDSISRSHSERERTAHGQLPAGVSDLREHSSPRDGLAGRVGVRVTAMFHSPSSKFSARAHQATAEPLCSETGVELPTLAVHHASASAHLAPRTDAVHPLGRSQWHAQLANHRALADSQSAQPIGRIVEWSGAEQKRLTPRYPAPRLSSVDDDLAAGTGGSAWPPSAGRGNVSVPLDRTLRFLHGARSVMQHGDATDDPQGEAHPLTPRRLHTPVHGGSSYRAGPLTAAHYPESFSLRFPPLASGTAGPFKQLTPLAITRGESSTARGPALAGLPHHGGTGGFFKGVERVLLLCCPCLLGPEMPPLPPAPDPYQGDTYEDHEVGLPID